MLRRLSVENYALIDKLEMELDPHLNIITGETGAGKSILLGALGLLLGGKNDGAAMKDAARNCTVEGTFRLAGLGLEPFFEENDLDYADETTLTRIISPAGKSRMFVNDVPVSLAQMRELGSRLVDIHSQHQNLILSSEEFRTTAIDTVAGNGALLERYAAHYARFTELQREVAALREAAEKGRRDEEWLRFQVEELSATNLREGEQAEIEEELAVLEHADRIGETLTALRNALDADETGIVSYVDNIVPNGSYEYFVQTVIEPDVAIDDETLCNVSNVMGITAHVDLPAPQNVQFISHENDGTNDLVTIGWDQAADLDPDLLFKSFNVFQVGSRVPDNRDDATGIIEELTDTEYTMNFLYRVRDVYVQNVFEYGKANSDTITIDLDNIGIAEGQNAAENRIVVEGDQVVATGGVAASIAVYGANGTLAVRGENTDRVSIANLPQGVYVAVVLRDGKGLATKFVKE